MRIAPGIEFTPEDFAPLNLLLTAAFEKWEGESRSGKLPTQAHLRQLQSDVRREVAGLVMDAFILGVEHQCKLLGVAVEPGKALALPTQPTQPTPPNDL